MKKILAVPLVCAGLSMPAVTLGSPIEPGFDLFITPGPNFEKEPPRGTYIDFPDGSRVWLKGNSKLLASEDIGRTDTIVERKPGSDPDFDFPDGEVTNIGIEVVALSLKSIEPFPFDVSKAPPEATRYVDDYVGNADLYVTVNALKDRPSVGLVKLPDLPQPDKLKLSIGSMTIDHKGNPDGLPSQGDFTSELKVYADLIFVVAGEDIGDEANWLASMPAPDTVKLEGKGHWTHELPADNKQDVMHNDDYPAGEFYVTKIKHVGPHPVTLSVTLDYFTATAGNSEVALKWATGTEKDNAGFKVWRGQPLGGQCSNDPNNYTNVQAISPLVASQGTEVSGATYTMTDSNVVSGNTYCYALEDHDFGGKSTFHLDDIVSAMP